MPGNKEKILRVLLIHYAPRRLMVILYYNNWSAGLRWRLSWFKNLVNSLKSILIYSNILKCEPPSFKEIIFKTFTLLTSRTFINSTTFFGITNCFFWMFFKIFFILPLTTQAPQRRVFVDFSISHQSIWYGARYMRDTQIPLTSNFPLLYN